MFKRLAASVALALLSVMALASPAPANLNVLPTAQAIVLIGQTETSSPVVSKRTLVAPVLCTHCSYEDCMHHECNTGLHPKRPPVSSPMPIVAGSFRGQLLEGAS